MQFPTQIFKAYDVRGKVGTELTPDIAERIGAALAVWLPETGAVAVGHDMRPDSTELATAVITGLTRMGRDVIDIGQVASDMIYFATGHLELAGGAMVTASHNPGDDNGIKLCREAAKPIGVDSGLLEIRDLAAGTPLANAQITGEVTERNITDAWIEHALSFVTPESWPAYKVVVDAGNGMAGAIIPHLTNRVPLDIDQLYFELDGTFPNHIANPIVPENLLDLQARIAEFKADFGVAFDGDGDRAVLVDENGQALSGTVTTAILARYFLSKHPGATILYNAVCGRVVRDVVEADGGKSYRTKVGHSFIKSDMRKYDAILAGEHSGHYYFRDNFYADSGLIAVLVAVQVLAESGKTLNQLAREYQTYRKIDETNYTVADKDAMMVRLKEHFDGQPMDELDGLTVHFKTGWLNVRPSNTEPLLRLNAEATNQEELEQIVSQAAPILIQT